MKRKVHVQITLATTVVIDGPDDMTKFVEHVIDLDERQNRLYDLAQCAGLQEEEMTWHVGEPVKE